MNFYTLTPSVKMVRLLDFASGNMVPSLTQTHDEKNKWKCRLRFCFSIYKNSSGAALMVQFLSNITPSRKNWIFTRTSHWLYSTIRSLFGRIGHTLFTNIIQPIHDVLLEHIRTYFLFCEPNLLLQIQIVLHFCSIVS